MRDVILGIDPGLTGGIAAQNISTSALEVVVPMPIVKPKSIFKVSAQPEIDAEGLLKLLKPHAARITHVVIEGVHSMPGQGVASMFKFGFGYGLVCGVLESLALDHGFTIQKAVPAVWKSTMGLSCDKRDSLTRARELWPSHDKIWKLRKNDGLAEAALLCEFARRSCKGITRKNEEGKGI